MCSRWNEVLEKVRKYHGNNNGIDDLKQELQEVKEALKKLQEQSLKGESNYKRMDRFISRFKQEYHGDTYIKQADLELFIIRTLHVSDSRTIKNKIRYLEAHGLIRSSFTDVYTITI